MRFTLRRALAPATALLLVSSLTLATFTAAEAASTSLAISAKNPDVPTKSDLAALRAEADRAAASLSAGTRALETVQRRANALKKQAEKATRRSAALQAQLADLRQQVGTVASAAYRNPLGTDSMFGSPAGVGDDSLQAMGYLNVVSSRRSQVLREAETTRVRAEQAAREAAALAKSASAASADAARRVAALQRQAAVVGQRLTRAMAAYEAEMARQRAAAAAARARAARAARLAAIPRGGSCTGGGGREWGGYPNGFIPESALSALNYAPGHKLRCDAAAGFNKMTAAYAADHGGQHLCVTDSYRSYSEQQRLYREKPSLAAVPGTSNHGWALAVDLCGGAQRAGSSTDDWLQANAGRFGWRHPDWAEPDGSRPEPWHWEFGNIS